MNIIPIHSTDAYISSLNQSQNQQHKTPSPTTDFHLYNRIQST